MGQGRTGPGAGQDRKIVVQSAGSGAKGGREGTLQHGRGNPGGRYRELPTVGVATEILGPKDAPDMF